MHAVHRGSTTYPATTRSAPLGLDAHSKTSNTVQQRALGGVPGPAALMSHYVPICCTALQRVALQCNVLHWPAMQSACLDLPPRALVADAHTHHPLQHQSIADSAVGGRGCSHALLRHASPHSFATGRFPTHSTVSVSSCTRTALHRTALPCRDDPVHRRLVRRPSAPPSERRAPRHLPRCLLPRRVLHVGASHASQPCLSDATVGQ